ncbi:hypothetical protein [Polynucleobacter sp. AP-RePozz3-80-G7]|uniref:hypothetical protein n=1 Tax=Polynucleobacter sp. AP-RePozz3-80-G7 TaxID=2689105 RepID=UPI001C0B854B|nr:hypothetical protein [Polynucleobacter sp. AP-RePozz3-80-G7]MBU3638191.1 hypothetical protein [Polynucleobacter sp. AP-RePozz3-80-G7]
MNIKKISLIIALFIAIIALVNFATNKPYNSTSSNPAKSDIDTGKRNTNNYKLSLEQVKADCRVFTQLLQSALMYRYQTNNMVSYEDVAKKIIATANEQLGTQNINAEYLASFSKLASAYGSELSSEGMASNLAQGTGEREAKCVAEANIFLDTDGYYYMAKHASIINWDNAKDANFVINY